MRWLSLGAINLELLILFGDQMFDEWNLVHITASASDLTRLWSGIQQRHLLLLERWEMSIGHHIFPHRLCWMC